MLMIEGLLLSFLSAPLHRGTSILTSSSTDALRCLLLMRCSSLSPLPLFLHLQQKDPPPHEPGPAQGFCLLKRSPFWPLFARGSPSEFLSILIKTDVRWLKQKWLKGTTFNLMHRQNGLIQERRNSWCFFSMAGTWSHPATETKLVKTQVDDRGWLRRSTLQWNNKVMIAKSIGSFYKEDWGNNWWAHVPSEW